MHWLTIARPPVSRFRAAAKIDAVQPEIVKGLQAHGIEVYPMRWPVDLLLRFWCLRHKDYCWDVLEVKTPEGKKNPKARLDKRQKEQREFLAHTNTAAVISLDSALFAINCRHELESTRLPSICAPWSLHAQVSDPHAAHHECGWLDHRRRRPR